MTTTNLRTTLLAIALVVTVAACGNPTSSNDGRTATSRSAGSGQQAPSSAAVAAERPTQPVDRLVDVGHGKLHLRCTGEGPVTALRSTRL